DKNGDVIPGFLEEKARKLPIYEGLMKEFNGEEEEVFARLQQPKKMTVFTWEGDQEVEMSTMDSLKHYVSMLNTWRMAMDAYRGEIRVLVGGINHRFY